MPDGLCPVHSPVRGREAGRQWNLRMNLVVTRFLHTNCSFSTLYSSRCCLRRLPLDIHCNDLFIIRYTIPNYNGPNHSH